MSGRWGDKPELFEVFRSEATERLASLSDGLLALEAQGHAPGILQRICRDAHSIKGSAKLLGFDTICDVAHHMEDVLVVLRDGRRPLTEDVCDLLLSACDALETLVESGSPDATPEIEELCARLSGAVTPPAQTPPAPPDAAEEVAGTLLQDPPSMNPAADTAPPLEPAGAPVVEPMGDLPAPAVPEDGTTPERVPQPAPAETPETAMEQVAGTGGTVRLETYKVYALIDAVGEAVIGQVTLKERSQRLADLFRRVDAKARRLVPDIDMNRVPQLVEAFQQVREELAGLSVDLDDLVDEGRKQVEALQERAMALATFPASTILAPLPRLARDLCRQLAKEADLVVDDGGVELDKQILERIAEPLRALLINALDHGIEPPAEREAAGKPRRGTVTIRAHQQGGQVVIEVADDGRGVDLDSVRRRAVAAGWYGPDDVVDAADLGSLLFRPGFSTASRSTKTSGRGVGLDIVRDAIESLKGGIEVHTDGPGTRFALTVPTTLSIVEGVMVTSGGRLYALPVSAVSEVVQVPDSEVQTVAGRSVVDLRGEILPLMPLGVLLGHEANQSSGPVAILSYAGRSLALRVDDLGGQQEIVVKTLGSFVRNVRHVAGASILGNGDLVLVLDPASLLLAGRVAASGLRAPAAAKQQRQARVLVVDDAAPIREMERSILEDAGFVVETACDGAEALDLLDHREFDAVVSDVQMPLKDGLELCADVRARWPRLPFVMVTSLSSDEDRRRGLETGADAYLTKAEFDQGILVEILMSLVGAT